MLTIPHEGFTPYLPASCTWIKGQLELSESNFLHWQTIVAFTAKQSLRGVRDCFGPYHAELTYSEAASDYVWKDDTSVPGTRFELGTKPISRNSKTDWESVWTAAQSGNLMLAPAHIRITCYGQLTRIASDFARPERMDRDVRVYWGTSGSGKSFNAWLEAGDESYPKDPRTKWWTGYQGQAHVVIDEFCGGFDICHLLRWLDKFPVHVETKGGSRPLQATKIWITSNLEPDSWYPLATPEQLIAIKRRMTIVHFTEKYIN